ncbi:MAG: sigma-70 family RNA polymerase sigma factor [Deltaproteobacteria bacterium]|nr:sigma-70 family RNA polymerase sigma factor [Deltaproteobacteria bacterium]
MLYDRYAPKLARRLWRIFGRREEVHDALQSTFLQVFRSLPRYDPARPFAPWLNRVAFRVAGTRLRSRRRRWWLRPWSGHEVETMRGHRASAETRAITNQMVDRLYRAMESLPAKKRIAFALCELEGMGLAEVGELVGASPQTVWARVKSAREILRGRMAIEWERPELDDARQTEGSHE